MKNRNNLFWCLLIAFFLVPTIALSEPGIWRKGSGGWGSDSKYSRHYNTSSVETIKGEVEKVTTVVPLKGMSRGVHLKLEIEDTDEIVSIHLGPKWFLDNQDVTIKKGDHIEVTGSRVTIDGSEALIASEVNRKNQILSLRDETGFPRWSGWHQKENRQQS